jgi:hypothetical protein
MKKKPTLGLAPEQTVKQPQMDLLTLQPHARHVVVSTATASIHFGKETTKDEWASSLRGITAIERVSLFMLGDALIFGETLHGKKLAYKTASEITGKAEALLRNAVMVAKAIPASERVPSLGMDAHKAVVPLIKDADKKAKLALTITDAKEKKAMETNASVIRVMAQKILSAGGTVVEIRKKVAAALGKKPAKKTPPVVNRQVLGDSHQESLEEAAAFIMTLSSDEVKKDGKAWLFSVETILDAQRHLLGAVIEAGIMSALEASQKCSRVVPATGDKKISATD